MAASLYPLHILSQVEADLENEGPSLANQNLGNMEKQLKCKITSLEKTVSVQQSSITQLVKTSKVQQSSITQLTQTSTVQQHSITQLTQTVTKLERMVQDLHLKQMDTTVLRTLNPGESAEDHLVKPSMHGQMDRTSTRTLNPGESAEAHLVKPSMHGPPQTPTADYKHLQELKLQIISTYTPELLCHAVKKEGSELSPVEEMIHLAKTAYRLYQIQRSYEPSSNSWVDLMPLASEVIESLKILPAAKQQEKINQFWQDIKRIYNADHVLCTLFEVENIIIGGETYWQKRKKLTELLLNGQKLQESLKMPKKTSFMRVLRFRKKDKICKAKSIWNVAPQDPEPNPCQGQCRPTGFGNYQGPGSHGPGYCSGPLSNNQPAKPKKTSPMKVLRIKSFWNKSHPEITPI